ncbi:SCP domain-containing protein [Caenorhabditis elegans]|uniref:SCP domain-containing protein n=1 Tax=Caenorhabditis elegans TaxID=6239 RepID=Q9NAM4_CAEEL|nr:SCP domain-containing protein [Caenorhabditis elegans]CAB54362.2 SCP domain-containing protein [Caenorhabditis elegans]|eukprot:NP_502906.2 Uncharacterized protein CELE_Y105C5B.17 [Caenorhabditis elegans]
MLLRNLLFLFVIFVSLSDAKKLATSTKEQTIMINIINTIRQKEAMERKISNMHELVFDEELAKKEFQECSWDKDHFINVKDANNFAAIWSYNHSGPFLQMNFRYFINPVQTKIGCSNVQCKGKNFKTFACIMGPEFNQLDFEVRKGEPGEHCPAGRTEMKMCTSEAATFTGYALILIAILNFFWNI